MSKELKYLAMTIYKYCHCTLSEQYLRAHLFIFEKIKICFEYFHGKTSKQKKVVRITAMKLTNRFS